MEIKFKIIELDEVVGKYILPKLKTHNIFTFTGPLGAGKTTLISKILEKCGVKKIVTSPTFNYVNTYSLENTKFNHFDLYRINTLQDFLATGFDEYLYDETSFNFIEWPEIIKDLLSDKSIKLRTCNIYINYDDDNLNSRVLKII